MSQRCRDAESVRCGRMWGQSTYVLEGYRWVRVSRRGRHLAAPGRGGGGDGEGGLWRVEVLRGGEEEPRMAANVQAVRMASTISACGFPWWAVQRTRLESSLTGRGSPRPDAPTPGTQTGTLSHRCTTHLDLDTASRRDALLFSFAQTLLLRGVDGGQEQGAPW